MMKDAIKVAIADDHVLFVKGMKMILDDFAGIQLVITAYDGQELIEQIPEKRPDVVLLDYKMPGLDGAGVIQWLKRHYPDIRILMLTMHDDHRLITHFLKEGVHGYLLKNEEPETVLEAIRSVREKGMFMNDTAAHAMLRQLKTDNGARQTVQSEELQELTEREMEVLRLICQEKTTAEIAQVLYLSPRTVEGYRKSLLEKTGARNIAGLVIFATRNKLLG